MDSTQIVSVSFCGVRAIRLCWLQKKRGKLFLTLLVLLPPNWAGHRVRADRSEVIYIQRKR